MSTETKPELENAGVFEVATSNEVKTTGRVKTPVWKYVLAALAAIIAVLVVIISLQPSDFRVARSAAMAAPPAKVFDQVNNFHNWEAWSPWAKLDPAAKSSFDGPTSGEGAYYSWDGNSDVGAGSMTIVESRPHERIRIRLDFIRPFAASSDVTFTFQPEGDATVVNWSMAGKNNFLAKAISLVMDCEEMVGGQFDEGLASIKSIVEKSP
jgi:uncharacterized protein YndB with AHSA1/START domain